MVIDDSTIDKEFEVSIPREFTEWEKWFAWKPVTIHGKRYWMTTVYRRWCDIAWPRGITEPTFPSLVWEYGTIFDVLKD